jgi:hypothetical protein
VLLLLPSLTMTKQDWTPSKVTLGHLQSLMNQGFMTVTKLVTCCVLGDLTFPTHADGYIVTFIAF